MAKKEKEIEEEQISAPSQKDKLISMAGTKKQIEVADLPGVGEKTAQKMKEAGFVDMMAVAAASPSDLAEAAEIGEPTAAKIIQAARDAMEMGYETATKVLERKSKMIKITTRSKNLDNLLGGGVETGGTVEAHGAFGSGKSQIAHQLAVNVQLPPEKGGAGGGCLFIDTENTFSPGRIEQMAKALKLDSKKVLDNIFIGRAYNSLLGSEPVCILNDKEFHNTTIGDVVENRKGRDVTTFSFDSSGSIVPAKVSDLIEHEIGANNELFKIKTVFGREVTVTGAHSLFKGVRIGKRGKTVIIKRNNMRPESCYASLLEVGDHIAIGGSLSVPEIDRKKVNLVDEFFERLPKDVKGEIIIQNVGGKKYFKLKHTGRKLASKIPAEINVNEDVLWFLGFWIAEGNTQYKNRYVRLRLNSEDEFCAKAKEIVEREFGIETFLHKNRGRNGSLLLIPSRLLCLILKYGFAMPIGVKSVERNIPDWIFKLPKEKIKHFLKGYWDGDGYHAKSRPKNRLIFTTSSKRLAHDLSLLLLRLKVVANIYEINFKYYKNPKSFWHQPYRIEAAGLNIDNPISLDKVQQNLNAPRWNDIVFAKIKSIEKIRVDPKTKVYDFEVNSNGQQFQNFIAGFGGVLCHNSDHQCLLAEKAGEIIKQKNIKLIVVDSVTALFRTDYSGRGELAPRQQKLNRHLHTLQRLADVHGVAVFMTNQVMSRPDMMFGDPTAPIGGHIMGHFAGVRLYLRKSKGLTRIARMIDAPHLPEGECVFTVTEGGVGDPEE